MAQSQVFYTRHDGGVTFVKNGKSYTISNTHVNFEKVLKALREKKYDNLETLMSVSRTITENGVAKGGRKVFVRDGTVFYTDSHKRERELEGPLVDRILDAISAEHKVKFADALIAFLDNIMKNPRKEIREELYQFLQSGKAPITYDGCFLAYKNVRNDFMDIHSGTFDNSPGKMPSMPFENVNPDRTQTCSRGLHFATRGYLSSYSMAPNYRTVIVKVNPRHVGAIPNDYDYQKGRASRYYVVGELKGGHDTEAFVDSFIDEDTKQKCAPNVDFVESLKPSLKTLAESYGIVVDGRVDVVADRKGNYVPVLHKDDEVFDFFGNSVEGEVKNLSFETKTVRAAVKKLVDKLEKS